MDLILLVARVLLALVFVVAGLAKLADRAGARQALRHFGVPAVLATPLGTLLPLAELAVAVALLPAATAWWGALGALALLLLFVVGIGFNLARGRTPECHCFGELHSAPVGWSTLLRTGVLALVAGFVAWQGRTSAGPSVLSGLGAWPLAQGLGLIAGVLALALGAAEGWLLVQLLQQNGRLLARHDAWHRHHCTSGDRHQVALIAGMEVADEPGALRHPQPGPPMEAGGGMPSATSMECPGRLRLLERSLKSHGWR